MVEYAYSKKWSTVPFENPDYIIITDSKLRRIINSFEEKKFHIVRIPTNSKATSEYLNTSPGIEIKIRHLIPQRMSGPHTLEFYSDTITKINNLAKRLRLPLKEKEIVLEH